MGGKVHRINIVISVQQGEISRHLIDRGSAGNLGRWQLLPTLPDVLPDLLHDFFDINLGNLQPILHALSLTWSRICATSKVSLRDRLPWRDHPAMRDAAHPCISQLR